jgi:dimeric dUTPase (all-alpha-NTP-PPase superfamily)
MEIQNDTERNVVTNTKARSASELILPMKIIQTSLNEQFITLFRENDAKMVSKFKRGLCQ